jgi:hypothetical protein
MSNEKVDSFFSVLNFMLMLMLFIAGISIGGFMKKESAFDNCAKANLDKPYGEVFKLCNDIVK